MSVPPATRKLTERQFQMTVVELAKTYGFSVCHFHDSRRQVRPNVFVGDKDAAGFPDLTLVRERVVFAELKTEHGKLSRAQEQWYKVLVQAGQEVYVWRPSSWGEIQDVLSRRLREVA